MSDKEGAKERSRSRSPLRTKSPDNEIEDDEPQQSDLDDTNNSNIDEKPVKDEPNSNSDEKPSKEVTKKSYRYVLVQNLPATNYTRKQLATMFAVLMGPDRPEKVFYEVVRDSDNCPTGKYIFKFNDEAELLQVYKSFQRAKFEGKSINPQLDPEIAKDYLLREFRYISKTNDRFDAFRKNEWTSKSTNAFIKQVVLPPEPLPDHTFGLSVQYLKTLNVDPPLRRKICVLHLCHSVDEAKLREVFSLAGQVTDVKLLPPKANFPDSRAFVEFDHPVEAVQAISMFHNQKLNGKKMIVRLDNLCKRVLPRGLEGIGPGLGLHGEPLKGVRAAMDIKSLEQKIEKELSNKEPNQNTDNTPNNQLLAQLTALLGKQTQGNLQSQNISNNGQNPSPFGSNVGQNAPNFGSNASNFGQNTPNFATNTPFGQNASNFGTNASNFGPNFGQNVPNFGSNSSNFGSNRNFGSESNFEQNVLNRNQSMSNMGQSNAVAPKIPTFTQNVQSDNWNTQSSGMQSSQYGSDASHYVQQHSSNDRREFDVKSHKRDKDSGNSRFESNKKKPDTLVFSYLPPSVNAQSLNMKMNEIGELVFGEVTGQGRAIVRFKNPSDADKCIKLFDRSKVDGQIISVKYL